MKYIESLECEANALLGRIRSIEEKSGSIINRPEGMELRKLLSDLHDREKDLRDKVYELKEIYENSWEVKCDEVEIMMNDINSSLSKTAKLVEDRNY